MIAATDWVADLRPPSRCVGYFRGADGASLPDEVPVVSIDPDGELRVTAELYDQLRFGAEGDDGRTQALGELLVMLRLDDTDPSAAPARERAEGPRALVDAFLAGASGAAESGRDLGARLTSFVAERARSLNVPQQMGACDDCQAYGTGGLTY